MVAYMKEKLNEVQPSEQKQEFCGRITTKVSGDKK